MGTVVINIASDFTKTPGPRHIKDGPFSGEEFREKILKEKFDYAMKHGLQLVVNLDGGYGYGPSFLDEAFGGLARETKDKRMLDIKIISDEEPGQIENIEKYIKDGLSEG